MTIEPKDVDRAAQTIKGSIVETPFLHSITLSAIAGAEVYLKFENLQFTGAFKERGALNRMANLSDAEKTRGVIAMSAGNHAQAVAYHAQKMGIPATIVMPAHTPFVKVTGTERLGAKVVLVGDTLVQSQEHAEKLSRDENLVFIHPYNDPLVIAGQGTIALEMLDRVPDLDTMIVPVGGGGLIGGMAVAAKGRRPDIHIVGVEPQLYPSMSQALENNVADCTGPTIAEGIAVKHVGSETLPLVREYVDKVLTVSEMELERAVYLLLEIEKSVVEGAGAASLAALLSQPELFKGQKVGLVLSGGNIDPRLLASVIMRELMRDGRICRLEIQIPDVPGQLSRVTGIIGDAGGSIIEVSHQRMALDVSAKLATLEVMVETRDGAHVDLIAQQLRDAGFDFRIMDVTEH